MRPPMPHRLVNPASFVDILVTEGQELFFSKRDAASFFDTLLAPPATRAWFCFPPVRAQALCDALGWSLQQLNAAISDDTGFALTSRTLVFPSSRTWPMGFAWSSAVAQDTTVGTLLSTGFPEDHIVCDTEPFPVDQRELAVVATDDVIFIHRDQEEALDRLSQYDAAMYKHGIQQATDKDVNAAGATVALGCELTSRPAEANPDTKKLWPLLQALVELFMSPCASPLAVHSMMGVGQWFSILSRPHFACFGEVYEFVRREPGNVPQQVPEKVINELLIFAGLAPLLSASLEREWCTTVVATDAAPEYGIGVSVADLPPGDVADLGRLSERRGDYIRLNRDRSVAEPERPRVGQPTRLNLRQEDFVDVLSIRAARKEHSGILELKGVLTGLRWILRSSRNFHKRLLFLIDAKAALSAVAKGRSGAPEWEGTMCAIMALLLASGALMRPLYIPSEDNPADHPSRGRRRRPPIRKVKRKETFSKPDRRLHRAMREFQLRGAFVRSCSDFDTSSDGGFSLP